MNSVLFAKKNHTQPRATITAWKKTDYILSSRLSGIFIDYSPSGRTSYCSIDLVKFRNNPIWIQSFPIALKFYRRLGNEATEMPVKFHSDTSIITSNLKTWNFKRFCGMASYHLVNRGPQLWASYQIRKIAGCACTGNAGNVCLTRRLQRKPLVSDPDMHHGTCVTHVPWCLSGSLNCGGGENVTGIFQRMRPRNFTYLVRNPLNWIPMVRITTIVVRRPPSDYFRQCWFIAIRRHRCPPVFL